MRADRLPYNFGTPNNAFESLVGAGKRGHAIVGGRTSSPATFRSTADVFGRRFFGVMVSMSWASLDASGLPHGSHHTTGGRYTFPWPRLWSATETASGPAGSFRGSPGTA
jgi:hypothetical protein